MYGAIIGDLAGSIYEYSQLKKVTPIYTVSYTHLTLPTT